MTAVIVVPCYNEGKRLPVQKYRSFLNSVTDVKLLFVNDGSRDNTREILDKLSHSFPQYITVMHLEKNTGKAEAVRQGILDALKSDVRYVGFWDADLSTPLETTVDFCSFLDENPSIYMVFGARVQLLGKIIERSPFRHYIGRIFATIVSAMLKLKVYDTQCGAKIFRVTPEVTQLFQERFLTKWIFDVEIIARWMKMQKEKKLPPAEEIIYEYPLPEWRHVKDSRITLRDSLRILQDLQQIYRIYK